jgi:D-3-phosphoglycerate dehydrogenase
VCQAREFVQRLAGDDEALHKEVERGKKQFRGFELPGRTLGVIGLGAIGVEVANMALSLGMHVVGYDATMTVERAWQLSSTVQQAGSVDDLLSRSDFVTFHVPLTDETRHMINASRLQAMKPGVVILNFARDGIIDNDSLLVAIDEGRVYSYVCDFPTNALKGSERVIALPHLGASTSEAEDNCAVMVAGQLRDFLEHGTIRHSVNFPDVEMPDAEGYRLTIVNANVPNMVGQISTDLAKAGLNIVDMLNKSRGDLAYTLVDVDSRIPEATIREIETIDGVLAVRSLY